MFQLFRASMLVSILVLAIGCVRGMVPTPPIASDDENFIQGVWKLTSTEGDAPNFGGDVRMVFREGKFTIYRGIQVEPAAEGKYRLFPDKNPKVISMQGGGPLDVGIYQFDGQYLFICLTTRGTSDESEAPADFKPLAGKGQFLMKLQHVQ